MNKLRHIFFLCFLMCATVVLSSCSKDDDKDASPATKEGMLTAGDWKSSKLIYEGETMPYPGVTLRFKTGGTYTATYDGETETGTWELTNDDTYLMLDDEAELKIKKLDSKNLQLLDEEWDEEIHFVR